MRGNWTGKARTMRVEARSSELGTRLSSAVRGVQVTNQNVRSALHMMSHKTKEKFD